MSRSDSRAPCKTCHGAGPKLTMCSLPQRSSRRVRTSLPVIWSCPREAFPHRTLGRPSEMLQLRDCDEASISTNGTTSPEIFAASSHIDDRSLRTNTKLLPWPPPRRKPRCSYSKFAPLFDERNSSLSNSDGSPSYAPKKVTIAGIAP